MLRARGWVVTVGVACPLALLACSKGQERGVSSQVELPGVSAQPGPAASPTPTPTPGLVAEPSPSDPSPEVREGLKGTRPSAAQVPGLGAPVSPRRLTLTPRSLGPVDRDTTAGADELAALFPECAIAEDSYDHLGEPAPYFEVVCGGVAILGVLASPGADDGSRRVVAVRVLAREITPPSGFGVGARLVPLIELNPDIECRRAVLPGAGDLFPEASTICAGRLAPNILYLFRGRDVRPGAPDSELEAVRIDELLWLAQAAP